MFDGFALDFIEVAAAVLRVRHGGEGPPLLLLHGHPRTHTTWWRVAPLLADHFYVVCPDLRGFGQSSKPKKIRPITSSLRNVPKPRTASSSWPNWGLSASFW